MTAPLIVKPLSILASDADELGVTDPYVRLAQCNALGVAGALGLIAAGPSISMLARNRSRCLSEFLRYLGLLHF